MQASDYLTRDLGDSLSSARDCASFMATFRCMELPGRFGFGDGKSCVCGRGVAWGQVLGPNWTRLASQLATALNLVNVRHYVTPIRVGEVNVVISSQTATGRTGFWDFKLFASLKRYSTLCEFPQWISLYRASRPKTKICCVAGASF